MAPSKLSTLTDEWVTAFTPFRSKVCLVGFLMTMVLPNMKHAWGFAGFKDQHDKLRVNSVVKLIEDGCRNADRQRSREKQRTRQGTPAHSPGHGTPCKTQAVQGEANMFLLQMQ